ncbi:MAG: adenine phosphoribosyltransferase [Nanoarchaeota archaeon]|nr:adenine phosphoribosyltransferase [Nanoarchaeota archaeon]
MDIKKFIRTVPNWPKEGVMFRDITTLLKNPEAVKYVMDKFYEKYKDVEIDKVVGVESRGFIFGSLLAERLNKPFILARKPKKLPAEHTVVEYELEYGKDALAIHNDGIDENDSVLIVDDLLATAGTLNAVIQIVEKLKGNICECACVIELPDLKGREKIKGYDVFSLVEFAGD